MTFTVNRSVRNILILGAGASSDYGLPLWKNLGTLIIKEIRENETYAYKYKKEILEWLDKIGENKAYETLDKCIVEESILPEYDAKSIEIEDEIFIAMNNIFEKMYKANNTTWIRILNDSILRNNGLENTLAFINFNYDDVLEKNLLKFSYLPRRQKELIHRIRLDELLKTKVQVLYPHGKLSDKLEDESHITIYRQTVKSYREGYFDAVSCYDVEKHVVVKDNFSDSSLNLFILGLGGGLKVNLDNIEFPHNNIASIHVTIKDSSIKEEVIKYLSEKYKTAIIKTYLDCEELAKKSF